MTEAPIPVVFIHGLWLAASSWNPWLELFAARGFDPVAPTWPGEPESVDAAREDSQSGAGHGIDDVTTHYAEIIGDLGQSPIIIGHSFGGMITEKLLGQNLGRAGVAIDAAQIKGVLPLPLSSLRSTLPVFKDFANEKRSVSLTAEQFRYSFGNELTEEESDTLWAEWNIPSPGKPLFEAASANFSRHSPAAVETGNDERGPLLLIAGGKDHTVPTAITKSTLKQYRHSTAVTELVEFPDRGHSLTIDHGWREVAESILSWIDARVVNVSR
ncbi:alpha/beta hydrolase [uncultured Microbacterium sp.]|uniref:alpha/beta hydrolase n=1 Tax=uncultured Microbacterium sp. TaxID=191216 RepID=UPI0035CB7622